MEFHMKFYRKEQTVVPNILAKNGITLFLYRDIVKNYQAVK